MRVHDFIVVGSGCAGAMAAQTLVDAGKNVTMLDAGISPQDQTIPNKDFLTVRNSEPRQYEYFIGKNIEGIGWGKVGKAEQITPPRRHMVQDTDTFLPVSSDSFSPVESLAYGGLGVGWGIGCWAWSPRELKAAGLDAKKMATAYNTVARRIGISAQEDDAQKYTLGQLASFQPATTMDRNHLRIFNRYQNAKAAFSRQGFVMGRAPLALLTKRLGSRKPYGYKDMDFYSDADKSAYRPWITVDQLRHHKNFTYIGNKLVVRFTETNNTVHVDCIDITTKKEASYLCKKLVLAPGVLGTARIVLRSLGDNNSRLPVLCNPYSYVPCLQPAMVGKAAEPRKLGFAQLSLFLDEKRHNFGASMASLYGYQSLMLFRLIRQVPLNFADARILLQYLLSSVVIMGIHHPDSQTSDKHLRMQPDSTSPTGDRLMAHFALSREEQRSRRHRERKYMAAARKLGLVPLKRIDPGFGASIHYAGCLPFSKQQRPFALAPNGKLYGTKDVYVADGSGFAYLPAKGLTFSLMANAHIIATNAAHEKTK